MRPIWLCALALCLLPVAVSANVASIFVDKSEKKMQLLDAQGKVLKEYRIKMGAQPKGHKTQQGDEKTPEGDYVISGRNRHSSYHRSLRISYPNAKDVAQARKRGVSPGGDIMIHGLPNGVPDALAGRFSDDWTDGCIAVTNAQIMEIWESVPDGTPIRITY